MYKYEKRSIGGCSFHLIGDERMIYDVIIIGAGAAGLSAALYASRAKLKVLVIDKDEFSGSQIVYSHEVDNYLGIPQITGLDMMEKFKEHIRQHQIEIQQEKVENLDLKDGKIEVELENGNHILTHTIVLATGAEHNRLHIPGENEWTGNGVSYCAICDGIFYANKEVAVIGGGDTALEEALYLANICSKVYLIHRRHELRGSQIYQDRIKEKANIEFIQDTVVERISGEHQLNYIECRNVKSKTRTKLDVEAVFIAIGMKPETKLLGGLLEVDKEGYIQADESGITPIPGVFVAGDIRTKPLRQLITAVSDGANCIYSVQRYLEQN